VFPDTADGEFREFLIHGVAGPRDLKRPGDHDERREKR
jgi:hypothetical protein